MKNAKQQVSPSRRRFLRNAGISGGIAAVAATAPGAVTADSGDQGTEQKPREGYRLTKHILDYYKSASS